MATEPKPIHVSNGEELARLVDAVKEFPVILEKDRVRYRLSREEEEIWARYDLEVLLSALRTARGNLGPDEGEELKAQIYRAREEGRRPTDRP